MYSLIRLIFINFIFLTTSFVNSVHSQDQNFGEIVEAIQKDLRTLERAVYSQSFSENSDNISNQKASTKEAEQALTKHLLKLSELEKQIQELTNKIEEYNFKVDKLSNTLSKVQKDNQLRFELIEKNTNSENNNSSLALSPKNDANLPKSDLTQNKKYYLDHLNRNR